MFRHWLARRRAIAPAEATPDAMPEAAPRPRAKAEPPPLIVRPPSPQNVVDLFAGEWSSRLPPDSGLVSGGAADLFVDERIRWADRVLGPLAGMDVLELGPLEGGHSYMMHWLGVRSVTAVEANARAFLRLLCVKELLGITTLTPLLGDFVGFLQQRGDRRFDMVLASGVLYHMTEPLAVLELICGAADRILLWTHYYDPMSATEGVDAANFHAPRPYRQGDFACLGARRDYPEAALAWSGFSGGGQPYAVWLARDGILDFLQHRGFADLEIGFDHPEHPNGPAFAVAARRGSGNVR